MWRQWRPFHLQLCWSHSDTATTLSLLSAMNMPQIAVQPVSFILYLFSVLLADGLKGLSTPTFYRLCQWDWCNNQQEPVTVMKNETKKDYFLNAQTRGKKKKKEKGVKLKDEKKKGKACSHAPSRISEPSLHSLLFYVITWCDNLQIRHRPTCAHCMIWYWLSSCICEQHLLSEGAGISMLS